MRVNSRPQLLISQMDRKPDFNLIKQQKIKLNEQLSDLQIHRLTIFQSKCHSIMKKFDPNTLKIHDKYSILNKLDSINSRTVSNLKIGTNYKTTKYEYISCIPPKTGRTFWHEMFNNPDFGFSKSINTKRFSKIIKNSENVEHLSQDLDGFSSHRNNQQQHQDNFYYFKKYFQLGLAMFDSQITEEDLEINQNLNKFDPFLKFISVRHPFSRLYSVWYDKFHLYNLDYTRAKYSKIELKTLNHEIEVGFGEYWKEAEKFEEYGEGMDVLDSAEAKREAEKMGASNNHADDLQMINFLDEKIPQIKFSTFLKWIVYGNALTDNYNKYWGSYYGLCSPCLIDYNMIVKFENITSEYEEVAEKLTRNTQKNYETPGWDDSYGLGEYENHACKNLRKRAPKEHNFHTHVFFQKINLQGPNYLKNLLKIYQSVPKIVTLRLYEIYKLDFILFDYDFKSFL